MGKKIYNTSPIAAPTAAPAATMPAAGTAHYYKLGGIFSKAASLNIMIEDADDTTTAIDRAEVKIFGYILGSSTPSMIFNASVSSLSGACVQPVVLGAGVKLIDYTMIYIQQAADDAVVGATEEQNPAFKYQLVSQS